MLPGSNKRKIINFFIDKVHSSFRIKDVALSEENHKFTQRSTVRNHNSEECLSKFCASRFSVSWSFSPTIWRNDSLQSQTWKRQDFGPTSSSTNLRRSLKQEEEEPRDHPISGATFGNRSNLPGRISWSALLQRAKD